MHNWISCRITTSFATGRRDEETSILQSKTNKIYDQIIETRKDVENQRHSIESNNSILQRLSFMVSGYDSYIIPYMQLLKAYVKGAFHPTEVTCWYRNKYLAVKPTDHDYGHKKSNHHTVSGSPPYLVSRTSQVWRCLWTNHARTLRVQLECKYFGYNDEKHYLRPVVSVCLHPSII